VLLEQAHRHPHRHQLAFLHQRIAHASHFGPARHLRTQQVPSGQVSVAKVGHYLFTLRALAGAWPAQHKHNLLPDEQRPIQQVLLLPLLLWGLKSERFIHRFCHILLALVVCGYPDAIGSSLVKLCIVQVPPVLREDGRSREASDDCTLLGRLQGTVEADQLTNWRHCFFKQVVLRDVFGVVTDNKFLFTVFCKPADMLLKQTDANFRW